MIISREERFGKTSPQTVKYRARWEKVQGYNATE